MGEESYSGEGLVVLNVDDDEANRYVISRVLRRGGFDVIEASSGTEALQLAERKPDLILLDVNMPDLDGFEVCRRLKSDCRLETIPVIYLSATTQDSLSMAEGMDTGADAFLTQPIDPRVLLAAIRASLRARGAERELRSLRHRLDALARAAITPLVLVEGDGRVAAFSPPMAELLEKAPGELLGRPVGELLGDGAGEVVAAALEAGSSRDMPISLAGRSWTLLAETMGPAESADGALVRLLPHDE